MFSITSTATATDYSHGDSVDQTVSAPTGAQAISGTYRIDYSSDGGTTWTESALEQDFVGRLLTDFTGYRVTGSIAGAEPAGIYKVTAAVVYMQLS